MVVQLQSSAESLKKKILRGVAEALTPEILQLLIQNGMGEPLSNLLAKNCEALAHALPEKKHAGKWSGI